MKLLKKLFGLKTAGGQRGPCPVQKGQSPVQKKGQCPLQRQGQMVVELLWLVLFACGFLAVMSHLYEVGEREIARSQKGLVKPSPLNKRR